MEDLDIPIALRRPRRSALAGTARQADHLPSTSTPATPKAKRKTVRFSDPGPGRAAGSASSTGLTPRVRRTAIGSPKRRRTSAPARASGSGMRTPGMSGAPPLSPTWPATDRQALHRAAEGRVERRIRRANLRQLLNKLEADKKQRDRLAQSQISHLQSVIRARDGEIHELQNATIIADTERIWDLEGQIESLQSQLSKPSSSPWPQEQDLFWPAAGENPFLEVDMDLALDEDQFGDSTVAQLVASTPVKRLQSGFPTPPATSPAFPGTPSRGRTVPPPTSCATVQVSFPDPTRQELQEEAASLRLETRRLSNTLESYRSLYERLAGRLSAAVKPATGRPSTLSPLEKLEEQVATVVQSMSDRTAALTLLTSSICDLGFPGSDAGEMMTSLASGFRTARLELEYLTPGEISLPLSSRGAQVLDLLLNRLRELSKKVQEDEEAIDEYHEIEQSLRKQLAARVSVMDGLKAEMGKAEKMMSDKNSKIRELQVANDRLKGAVNGYVRDIRELEQLVQRMEQQGQEAEKAHRAQEESDRQLLEMKEADLHELQEKLAQAVRQTTSLQKEMSDVQDSTTRQVVALNKKHGDALALRDARMLELREEMERVNESFRLAHETLHLLRLDNAELATQVNEERVQAKAVMDTMKAELGRVLQLSQEFLDNRRREEVDEEDGDMGKSLGISWRMRGAEAVVVARASGHLQKEAVKDGREKLRRGYDSGVGWLEGDEAVEE